MTAVLGRRHHVDDLEEEETRYEVIAVVGSERKRLAYAPDAEGVGLALFFLREEGDITNSSQVGIRDRLGRKWIVNPYAGGR